MVTINKSDSKKDQAVKAIKKGDTPLFKDIITESYLRRIHEHRDEIETTICEIDDAEFSDHYIKTLARAGSGETSIPHGQALDNIMKKAVDHQSTNTLKQVPNLESRFINQDEALNRAYENNDREMFNFLLKNECFEFKKPKAINKWAENKSEFIEFLTKPAITDEAVGRLTNYLLKKSNKKQNKDRLYELLNNEKTNKVLQQQTRLGIDTGSGRGMNIDPDRVASEVRPRIRNHIIKVIMTSEDDDVQASDVISVLGKWFIDERAIHDFSTLLKESSEFAKVYEVRFSDVDLYRKAIKQYSDNPSATEYAVKLFVDEIGVGPNRTTTVDINGDYYEYSMVRCAIEFGNQEAVKQILKRTNPNDHDKPERLFHKALYHKEPEMLLNLLNKLDGSIKQTAYWGQDIVDSLSYNDLPQVWQRFDDTAQQEITSRLIKNENIDELKAISKNISNDKRLDLIAMAFSHNCTSICTDIASNKNELKNFVIKRLANLGYYEETKLSNNIGRGRDIALAIEEFDIKLSDDDKRKILANLVSINDQEYSTVKILRGIVRYTNINIEDHGGLALHEASSRHNNKTTVINWLKQNNAPRTVQAAHHI